MKALKEKRISLRSLWRRGLVILSLFALVFASCADTDKGGGGTTATSYPVDWNCYGTLENPSYEGLPVDLTGYKIVVKYSDDSKEEFAASTALTIDPPYAMGVIVGDTDSPVNYYWVPYADYTLTFLAHGQPIQITVPVDKIVPIVRNSGDKYSAGTYSFKYNSPAEVYWNDGLHLTGGLTGKTVYVDDTPATSGFLNGLTLQAQYIDGEEFDIPITSKMDWEIRPRYNNGRDETGKGDLLLSVGALYVSKSFTPIQQVIDNWIAANPIAGAVGTPSVTNTTGLGNGPDAGLTVSHQFNEVYHVTSIELDPAPALDPFFYWDDDPDGVTDTNGVYTAWAKRLIDKGAGIKVTYTNGTTRNFTVEDAIKNNVVWYNDTPYDGWKQPFDILGVWGNSPKKGNPAQPTPYNKIAEPKIKIYYRGATTEYSVPVFTKFESLTVEPVSGDTIAVLMRQTDNDVGGRDATWFAKQIIVTATFSAPSTQDTTSVILSFDEKLCDGNKIATLGSQSSIGASVPEYDSGASWDVTGSPNDSAWAKLYTMDFGKPSWYDASGDTWVDNWTGHSPQYLNTPDTFYAFGECDKASNNGKDRSITIYYAVPYNVLDAGGTNNRAGVYPTAQAPKKAKVAVSWTGIHQR